MLHEILLSLSGHPSPLLRADAPEPHDLAGVTPPERRLLASAAHLSDVHVKLIAHTAEIAASHPSTICRAVAAAVDAVHLAAFQRKVVEVEESILKDDPDLVGAYNVVPLTAVMGEFGLWTRRMDWLWKAVQLMMARGEGVGLRHGAQLMDWLRDELQSGYEDIKEAAMSLVTVAETAWLKQVSAWILYGRLPTFGGEDFFVQQAEGSFEEYTSVPNLLPSFVTPATASSMLFIGKSLNHVRVKGHTDSGFRGLDHLSSELHELEKLTFPLNSASFSRTMTAIRLSLSQHTLQKLLPLAKVIEMLHLLRDFFLLGRGEFAMALTQEADDKIRNRWRRADNLAYEHRDDLRDVTVKDGEVAAVLARTWTVLASMQGQHAEEDEQLETARELLRLHLAKTTPATPLNAGEGLSQDAANQLATSPFRNLLFSVPVVLSIQLPSPLDMVLSPADLDIYSCINSYLLSMRRAHIRLTDLWKITSLRRHHPAPRGGGPHAALLRERWAARAESMRSSWTTASAAIFFLAETEAYLQTEVVAGLWEGFRAWLAGRDQRDRRHEGHRSGAATPAPRPGATAADDDDDDEHDLWLRADASQPPKPPPHDPQTLSAAHALYLGTLAHRLLLTQPSYTRPLHALLLHIDHLVSHARRLHALFAARDLHDDDAAAAAAFADLDREERDVASRLRVVGARVRAGVAEVVDALRALEADPGFAAMWEGEGLGAAGGAGSSEAADTGMGDGVGYVPARVGGINRLLMKLDFGSWFGDGGEGWDGSDD